MAVISLEQVQAWLSKTKLHISQVDPQFESTATNMILGSLTELYDISTWIDEASTPALVRDSIAMLVAAWTYQRTYSEDDPDGSAYAKWLEANAYKLRDGIKLGIIDLQEVPGLAVSTGAASFWPDDSTETINPDDGVKFTMGSRF